MDNNTQAPAGTTTKEITPQKESSIVDKNVEKVEAKQLSFPTFALLGGLIVAFIILKTFVYIKDSKRHGK